KLIEKCNIMNGHFSGNYTFGKKLEKSKVRIQINLNSPKVIYDSYYPFSEILDLKMIKSSDNFAVPYSPLSFLPNSYEFLIKNKYTGYYEIKKDFVNEGIYYNNIYYISTNFPHYYNNHLLVTS